MTATEVRVWEAWGRLGDDCVSPVKTVARQLGMSAGDVAFVVYPIEQFRRWFDDQEPELQE